MGFRSRRMLWKFKLVPGHGLADGNWCEVLAVVVLDKGSSWGSLARVAGMASTPSAVSSSTSLAAGAPGQGASIDRNEARRLRWQGLGAALPASF